MKKQSLTIIAAAIILFFACPVRAPIWTEGHHEINDGDVYGELDIYNDVTLDIFGGDIFRLAAFDTTITDWYGGQMDVLWVRDNSIVNIFGGSLDGLWAAENSCVNLCAYDVVIESTGGWYDQGYVTGCFLSTDEYFYFDLSQNSYLHINVVPEPSNLLLLGLGAVMLRKRK